VGGEGGEGFRVLVLQGAAVDLFWGRQRGSITPGEALTRPPAPHLRRVCREHDLHRLVGDLVEQVVRVHALGDEALFWGGWWVWGVVGGGGVGWVRFGGAGFGGLGLGTSQVKPVQSSQSKPVQASPSQSEPKARAPRGAHRRSRRTTWGFCSPCGRAGRWGGGAGGAGARAVEGRRGGRAGACGGVYMRASHVRGSKGLKANFTAHYNPHPSPPKKQPSALSWLSPAPPVVQLRYRGPLTTPSFESNPEKATAPPPPVVQLRD
jgi:hypothetical protein